MYSLRSAAADPLFKLKQLAIVPNDPVIELARLVLTSESTQHLSSSEVQRCTVKSRHWWRIIATKEKPHFFGQVSHKQPYKPELKFTRELIDSIFSDFAAFCCFPDGSQLQSKEIAISEASRQSDHSPIGKNWILHQELISKAKAAGFGRFSEEQIANMYWLSIQAGACPSTELLNCIQEYIALKLDINFLRLRKEKVSPRCTIIPFTYLNIPGFLQQCHTQFHTVRLPNKDDPAGEIFTRDQSDYPWFDVYTLLFIPLVKDVAIKPLAIVVTASDEKLEAAINCLFIGMTAGELNTSGDTDRARQALGEEVASAAAAASRPVSPRPSVEQTIKGAPRSFEKTFFPDKPAAFGLRNAWKKHRYNFYIQDIKYLTEKEIKQAWIDINRDIGVVGDIVFPTHQFMEQDLEASVDHSREVECYQDYMHYRTNHNLPYSDLTTYALQTQLLKRLKQTSFSVYTETQLLNLCLMIQQSPYNWLKTLIAAVLELFMRRHCTLSTPNPKKEPCHVIMPGGQGFFYSYHIYYTAADIPSVGIVQSEDTSALISMDAQIWVPLCSEGEIKPISLTLRSHSSLTDQYIREVAQDIERGALIPICDKHVSKTVKARKARAAQQVAPVAVQQLRKGPRGIFSPCDARFLGSPLATRAPAAASASAHQLSPSHIPTSDGAPGSGSKRKQDERRDAIFSPGAATGQTGLSPAMARVSMTGGPSAYHRRGGGGRMRQPDFDQSLGAADAADNSLLASPLDGSQFAFPSQTVAAHPMTMSTPRSTRPTRSSPLASPLPGSPSHSARGASTQFSLAVPPPVLGQPPTQFKKRPKQLNKQEREIDLYNLDDDDDDDL